MTVPTKTKAKTSIVPDDGSLSFEEMLDDFDLGSMLMSLLCLKSPLQLHVKTPNPPVLHFYTIMFLFPTNETSWHSWTGRLQVVRIS
jgi:hypothetical protein